MQKHLKFTHEAAVQVIEWSATGSGAMLNISLTLYVDEAFSVVNYTQSTAGIFKKCKNL